jgi:hypothetical protein
MEFARRAARVKPGQVGVGVAVCVGVIIALGTVQLAEMHSGIGPRIRGFDLEGEFNVPSASSAGLLVPVAGLAALLGRTDEPERAAFSGFGALVLVLALDEL